MPVDFAFRAPYGRPLRNRFELKVDLNGGIKGFEAEVLTRLVNNLNGTGEALRTSRRSSVKFSQAVLRHIAA